MTAFAAEEAKLGFMSVSCELRSVNHRYLDLSVKLPEALRFAEGEIRTLLGARISRGKIDCTLNVKKQTDQPSFTVNQAAVAALIEAANDVEEQMPAAMAYSALDILAFPGIQQEAQLDKTGLCAVVLELLDKTIAQILATRGREGEQLKNIINERCQKISQLAQQAEQRVPLALSAMRSRLVERINELSLQPDFERVEMELVMLTQKLDIMEELDRIQAHITEVLRVLELKEPVGRRLDFLMQELNREANTLGSKSVDKELTQISIELKVLIEQIREQVQNIE